MTRLCGCGCGASLEDLRADAVYASEACSKRARRAASPDKARTASALDEVRGRGEESGGDKARYTLVAREHITHTLIETGYFSAEDFDSLGIPPAHVNVCTSWIGHFSKRKVMEPISWRYSSKPSRKGGKVWTYKITQKGRDELPALLEETRSELSGLGTDNSSEACTGATRDEDAVTSVGAEPGESGPTGPGSGVGVANPQGPPGTASSPPLSAGTASPEPLSLLPEPDRSTSPYDPWKDAA